MAVISICVVPPQIQITSCGRTPRLHHGFLGLIHSRRAWGRRSKRDHCRCAQGQTLVARPCYRRRSDLRTMGESSCLGRRGHLLNASSVGFASNSPPSADSAAATTKTSDNELCSSGTVPAPGIRGVGLVALSSTCARSPPQESPSDLSKRVDFPDTAAATTRYSRGSDGSEHVGR